MNKNILLIVQNNSFPFDKRVLREANSLKGNGYNVFVISPKSNHDKESSININGITVKRYKDFVAKGHICSYLFEYLNSLVRIFFLTIGLLIKKKISVIHVANPPDFFWPIAIICKMFGIDFIYDQHDLSPEMSRSKFHSDLIYKLLLWNEKLTVKYSSAIIVVNETFKKRLIEKWNIKPGKCAVVYNGPSEDFLPLKNDQIVEKYKNKKIVLYIGLMTVNDNIEIIINAANELINNRNVKDVHFLLVGDGDVREQMEDLALTLGVSEYIEFTGIVNHAKVKEYLYISDVCIAPDLPNDLNEYLTLVKVLEYMKCSKAFVAFNLKETFEFAGDAGLYAENESDFVDKIQKLIENPKLEKDMGLIGNKIITDNYLWTHSEEKLLKLYNSI